MTKKWFGVFLLVFLFFSGVSILYPPFNNDSVRYSAPGNALILQLQELTNVELRRYWIFKHGRIFTHTILRLILQVKEPGLNILWGLFGVVIFWLYMNALKPGFSKKDNTKEFSVFLLLFVLCMLTKRFFIYNWFIHAHAVSNFLFTALIVSFLIPYCRLLEGTDKSPHWSWFLLAIIAGSAHEQASAVIPLLIVLAGFFMIKKQTIPTWFWIGFFAYGVGLTFLLALSSSKERIILYGSALSWDFMGEKINWLDLGWKRYFYSFFRHFILAEFKGFILPYIAIFLGLVAFLKKNHQSIPKVSWFFALLSAFSALVMTASPFFYGGPHDNPIFFLIMAILSLYMKILDKNMVSLFVSRGVSIVMLLFISITTGIHAMLLFAPAQNYRQARAFLEEEAEKRNKNPELIYIEMPQKFLPVFNMSPFLLERYGFESITIMDSNSNVVKVVK
ncbi:MAG: DUF6056 family protein [Brevinema sp.]